LYIDTMIMIDQIAPDSVVEKIRKLLALASELNDSKEQAEAALQKAKSLATQHEVDLATIAVFECKKSEEPIEKNDGISMGKRASVCQKFISWLLQDHFNVKVIYSGSRHFEKRMTLIGKKSDIEIAIYVNEFLNTEFMRLWHQYRNSNLDSQTKDRNSYFWGLHGGLKSKLAASETETKKEAFETLAQTRTTDEVEQVKNCMALTVTTDKERLNEKVEEFYPHLRTVRSYSQHHHSETARESGFSAGKNISLRRGISGGKGGVIE